MTPRFKYPRTPHLPWSPGATSDDKILQDLSSFHDCDLVMTEKMDGENITLYPDGYIHARSIDGNSHPSQDYIKYFAKRFQYMLEANSRICGEYLYAKHAINYRHLDAYFMAFSIWNEDYCFSWQKTLDICKNLDIITVPVIATFSSFDSEKIQKAFEKHCANRKDGCEGYVIRKASDFKLENFGKSVAKYVRKNHVSQDTENWRSNWNPKDINTLSKSEG